eukprot:1125980-Prorocentrum_minimum.AAC.1
MCSPGGCFVARTGARRSINRRNPVKGIASARTFSGRLISTPPRPPYHPTPLPHSVHVDLP